PRLAQRLHHGTIEVVPSRVRVDQLYLDTGGGQRPLRAGEEGRTRRLSTREHHALAAVVRVASREREIDILVPTLDEQCRGECRRVVGHELRAVDRSQRKTRVEERPRRD